MVIEVLRREEKNLNFKNSSNQNVGYKDLVLYKREREEKKKFRICEVH